MTNEENKAIYMITRRINKAIYYNDKSKAILDSRELISVNSILLALYDFYKEEPEQRLGHPMNKVIEQAKKYNPKLTKVGAGPTFWKLTPTFINIMGAMEKSARGYRAKYLRLTETGIKLMKFMENTGEIDAVRTGKKQHFTYRLRKEDKRELLGEEQNSTLDDEETI